LPCDTSGLVLAFTAGLFFGLSDTLVRAASVKIKPSQNLMISLLVGTPILWLAAIVNGLSTLELHIALPFIVAGILNFIIGRYLFYVAISYSGATTASIATSPVVVFSSLLAWPILGERLTYEEVTGVFLVMLAVYLVYNRPSGKPLHGGSSSIGVLFGLTSALVFSTTSLLVRMGAGYYEGDPIIGVAISYTTALLLMLPLTMSLDLGEIIDNKRSLTYMVLAATIVSLAQLTRYEAFSLCKVAKVSVLISLFPIHTLVFSYLLSGELKEKPEVKHVIAVFIAVAGVLLASI
jgi:drug/metabolite transporter (DMT)-like permease